MKKVICTKAAPAAVGPYSQAVGVGDLLFISGQIGIDPGTGKFVEGGIEKQVERVLKNIESIVKAAGVDLSSVVKTTVLLKSMDDFSAMNEVYAGFFPENPPARAAFEVGRLPLGALVEIEAVAYLG
ncbi:MAG: RidA family protein [Candidatus Krumholzibacteria bacterium]|nr:RidA family protein [Candidatus Krumholzibacteria bacterium]